MDLSCTNPNYISIGKNNIKKSVMVFISREQYLDYVPNLFSKVYKTRCGKCLACRLFKSYSWSNRLMAEASEWNYVYFVTFTYRDEDYQLEKLLEKPMRDFQLFMKRLRKNYKGVKIKYYATSELGGDTLRFHYHAIIYSDIHLFSDMRYYKEKLFTSHLLDQIWTHGYCKIAYATHDTMRYVSNYVQDTKNSIKHSFSQGLGYAAMRESDDGMYLVNGRFGSVTRTIKKELGIESDFIDLINLEKIGIYSHDIEARENAKRNRIIKKQFFRKKT